MGVKRRLYTVEGAGFSITASVNPARYWLLVQLIDSVAKRLQMHEETVKKETQANEAPSR